MNCTQSNDTLCDYIGEILKSEVFTGGQKPYKHGKKNLIIEYKICTRYLDLPSDTRILKYSLTSLIYIDQSNNNSQHVLVSKISRFGKVISDWSLENMNSD